jgi:hypothetical protein
MHGPVLGQVGGNAHPVVPLVVAFQHIGGEVVPFAVVEGGIDHLGIEAVGHQVAHIGELWHPGKGLDLFPVLPSIGGDGNHPVVGPRIKQFFIQPGFGKGHPGAPEAGAHIFLHRIPAPELAHDRKGIAIHPRGQVPADHLPGIAPVVGPEDLVGHHVEAGVRVVAHHQGRVPVPLVGILSFPGPGFDADAFAAYPVIAVHIAILRLGIDDVGIFRVDGHPETVSPLDGFPILIAYSCRTLVHGRTAQGVVVLGASVYIVKRFLVIHVDPVELGHRQVGFVEEGGTFIEGFIDASIPADQVVPGILGIDPQGMVVYMTALGADAFPGPAAVQGHFRNGLHGIDLVHIHRIAVNLVIVLSAGVMVAHFFPGGPPVFGPEKSPFFFRGFHDQVKHIAVGRRYGDAHSPDMHLGKPLHDGVPALPAILGAVHGRFGSAADLGKDMPPALLAGGIQYIRIHRIHHYIIYPCILADLQHLAPGLPAIGRLIQAAVPAGSPGRSFGCHKDHIGIPGVHHDASDLAGLFQSHVLPGLAAVLRFVDPVSIAQGPLVVVLPGSQPEQVGIIGVHGDHPHGVGSVFVKYGLEGGPVVHGLPNIARSNGYIPFAVIVRIYRKIGHPARGQGRTDASPFQAGNELGIDSLHFFIFLLFFLLGTGFNRTEEDGQGNDDGQQG